MSDFRPPEDYGPEDSLQENGLECCAGCEMQPGSESGHHGEVYTQSGTHHEYFLDTDPDDGPFFCPDCWPEVDAERRRQENQSLTDF